MKNKIPYHPLTATPFKNDYIYKEIAPCQALQPYIRCFWSLKSTINGYFDVGSRFEWLDRIIRPELLREFKRYHSMDIHKAKVVAFKNVGNIQDVFAKL